MSVLGLRPGSAPWLVGHELRLALRGATARRGAGFTLVLAAAMIAVVAGLGGVPLALRLRRAPPELSPVLGLALDAGVLAVFTLMLSQTLSSAVSAFFERGDLDLLLAAPLPPGRVLMARALAIAATPFLWFALFATPVIAPLILLARPTWALVYLVLAAVALLAGTTGMALAMGLFRLIGARRTRTVGQLLAALIGAGFFLASQSRGLLPDQGRSLGRSLMRLAGGRDGWSRSPLAWPGRAVFGEPIPLLALLALAAAAFAVFSLGLGRRFADDAALAAGAGTRARRPRTATLAARGFGSRPFPALVKKELRLLARDPILLSQVLLRTLYVVPMALLLVRGGPAAGPGVQARFALAAGAGAVVFMAGQVAGSLAWIVISAEDSPELLASAPVASALTRRAKLMATLVPVAILLAPPLLALAVVRPRTGLCALAGAALAAASSALVNLWFERPGQRRAFRSRRGGSVVGALSELLLGLGWAVAAALAALDAPVFALIPAAATLLVTGGLYLAAAPDRRY